MDYFAAPCRCTQCRGSNEFHSRFASRRDWGQFLRYYETFASIRGSFIQSEILNDPDVIEAQVNAPDDEWTPGLPPLFGWSQLVDAVTNVADQLIASRATSDKIKFYPRPEIPAERERKKRKAKKQESGLEAALARGMDLAREQGIDTGQWTYL